MTDVIWFSAGVLCLALIILDWEGISAIFFSKKRKDYVMACPKCGSNDLSIKYPEIDSPMMIGEMCNRCGYTGQMVEVENDRLNDFKEIMIHDHRHVKYLHQARTFRRFLLNPMIIIYSIIILVLLVIILVRAIY